MMSTLVSIHNGKAAFDDGHVESVPQTVLVFDGSEEEGWTLIVNPPGRVVSVYTGTTLNRFVRILDWLEGGSCA